MITTPVRRRPSRARGFTLIELLVSLVAGLIVALSLMGISKEVNDTFFEETRTSQAETALRLAMQRLSGDLGRAAFMSTPNIRWDPLIMHVYGGAGGNVPSVGYPSGIKSLAGIRLTYGGSNVGQVATLSAIQPTPLNPDEIDIAGNMTSPDRYPVLNIAEGAGACSGQRIFLQPKTPAMWRIVGQAGGVPPNTFSTATADQLMADIFQPVAGSAFILRVMDPASGASQYVQTCAAGAPAYNGGQPFVDVDPVTPIWTSAFQTSQGLSSQGGQKVTFGGFKGFGEGTIVNPVSVVRWSIQPESAVGASYAALNPTAAQGLTAQQQAVVNDPNQFDLTRQFLDVNGLPVGVPEVVAEYAIDLKFGFTVDNEQPLNVAPPDPNGAGPFGLTPNLLTFDFDDNTTGGGGNATWGKDISTLTTSPPGPQRIRSVRVRIATRSSVPDRTVKLEPVSPEFVITPPTGYLFTYCMDLAKNCVAPTGTVVGNVKPVWARVRSLVTQVTLQNQGRAFY
jgi:prepilin-type N-terminal cleavage/methylation domain-containing protein